MKTINLIFPNYYEDNVAANNRLRAYIYLLLKNNYKINLFALTAGDEKILKEKIKKFRLDELHHKNIAYEKGATKKGLYKILDTIIKTGSKVAINISEKI